MLSPSRTSRLKQVPLPVRHDLWLTVCCEIGHHGNANSRTVVSSTCILLATAPGGLGAGGGEGVDKDRGNLVNPFMRVTN